MALKDVDPTDLDTLAVYSDELLDQGDPHGEIIAGALNGRLDPRLTAAYERAQFGSFTEDDEWNAAWTSLWDPKTGFLRSIVLAMGDGAGFVRALAKVPAACFLQSLSLEVVDYLGRSTDPIPAFADAPLPKSLRKLMLGVRLTEDGVESESDFSGLRFRTLLRAPVLQRIAVLDLSRAVSDLNAPALDELERGLGSRVKIIR